MGTVHLARQSAVEEWRNDLARERAVYEPSAVVPGSGGAEWRRVVPGDPFVWQPPRTLSGAKRFFFPEREVLVRWSPRGVEDALARPGPFALIGLHGCDLAAIAYQDRFFAGDAFYEARRADALLVGVSCLAACPGGFCREVETGPFATAGFDLNLTPLGDEDVVIEVGSALGEAAIAPLAGALSAMEDRARARLRAARVEAEASFPPREFVRRAIERVNRPGKPAVSDEEWQAFGPSCLACTGCTSLCPTCSCFTVVDEQTGERDGRGHPARGERVRIWDSCLLEGFQREASGHHPAPRAGDRVRRFWFHKLSRAFAGFERIGCVGCGRCDITCPGSIGALTVLARLAGRDEVADGSRSTDAPRGADLGVGR